MRRLFPVIMSYAERVSLTILVKSFAILFFYQYSFMNYPKSCCIYKWI